jgi:hypothetical protein
MPKTSDPAGPQATSQRAVTTAGPRVLVLADMMFASKVRAVAGHIGVNVFTSPDPGRLLAADEDRTSSLVLIDLELRGAVDLIRQLQADERWKGTMIGFASHRNAEAIAAGREAGAHRVLARSAFVQLLPGLLSEIPKK